MDLVEMTYSYPVAPPANDHKHHWAAPANSDLAPMLQDNVRRQRSIFWMGVPLADIVESSIRIFPSLKSNALMVIRVPEESESASNVILLWKRSFSDLEVIAPPVAHQDASRLWFE
ncbi:MAG: hypothetical protein L0H08_25635 [Comamonas sp.]|nr:hypothetical protein [Comamonas sp.]MDN5540329.1 hypothetical protein [Comamonas sp.]